MNTDKILIEQLTAIAEVNPPISLAGISDATRVSFISMADVSESGRLLQKQERFLKEVKVGFTRFAEGDILFAKITPCMENGKGALARGLTNGLGFGSTEFHVLRANVSGEAEFIYQILQSREFRIKAEGRMTGSAGQKRVPADVFGWYRTFIPSLSEQRKIAKILSTVDAVIEKTESAIEKYKAIKQGMLYDLFTRGLDENGKLRPRYEDAPHLYKKTVLGWIPKTWEVDSIENVSNRIWIGLVTTMTTHYVEYGVPLIRNNNIKDCEIDSYDIIYLDNIFSEQNNHRYLHNGDIVTVHTGDIGTSAIITKEFDPSHGFATINTTVNPKRLINSYLCDYFNTPIFKNRIEAYATGDGRSNFNLYDYLYIDIPFPETTVEQKSISQKLNSIRELIKTESIYLKKYHQLKQALMQDLLTGRKRVKVDEAA